MHHVSEEETKNGGTHVPEDSSSTWDPAATVSGTQVEHMPANRDTEWYRSMKTHIHLHGERDMDADLFKHLRLPVSRASLLP